MKQIENYPTNQLSNSFSGLVNELFNGKIFQEKENIAHYLNNYPPTNILETENHFQINILAAGREKTDFKISLEKNKLTVEWKVPENLETANQENTKAIRTEYKLNNFKRVFNLNESINTESIEAKYVNGILSLQLSKKEDLKSENITIPVS